MSDVSAIYERVPASPQPGPPSRMLPLPTAHKPSRRKKIIAPLALVILGLAFLLTAFKLYPETAEHPTPPFPRLFITTDSSLEAIIYTVDPVARGKAMMRIELTMDGSTPQSSAAAGLAVSSPPGMTFVDCSGSSCKEHDRSTGLTFKRDGDTLKAFAHFPIKTHNLGVNYNGVTASAAFPEITYYGRGAPRLYVGYHIPSASKYDWASYPPLSTDGYNTVWEETLTSGQTLGRAAVGINHAAQASEDSKIFLAGALLGIAGGAIVTAFQEALHARD